jgi:hypothetical protein
MSAEHRQHPHNQSRHVLMKNKNYTEYIPVVPRYLTNSHDLFTNIAGDTILQFLIEIDLYTKI